MLFRMMLSRDAKMIPAVRQIAERVAQCAGYPGVEAVRIAASVGQAADAVFTRLVSSSAPDEIEIRFERHNGYLDVWLRYPDVAPDRPPAAVDAALSSEVLRQGMDSVEFGRDDGVAYCRLRRVLPTDRADDQCEMPPEGH